MRNSCGSVCIWGGFAVLLQRSLKIEVRYQDLQGQQQEMQLTGFVARIFQHEYDHLQVSSAR